jgi:RNA polymerase sigma-70 factor (ECF subfamily)
MADKHPEPMSPGPADADNRSSSNPITPLSLLDRARARDPVAWQRLVELYRPLVLFWCGRGGIPPADVEDVTQEIFVAAALGLERFHRNRPGDTFRGWLRGISRNQILLYFRKSDGQARAEGGEMAQRRLDGIIDPLSEPVEGEPGQAEQLYRRAIEQVRSEFEERTWQVFWLTAIDGRAPADLTEELGMGTAAIRQAKSRVLRRLKQEMGQLLE